MNLKLVLYPNPILETPCTPVTEFGPELSDIIVEMKDIMQKHGGIGLAANQVGLSIQLFIMKDKKGNIHEFINPKIIDTDGMILTEEGCLSTPGIFIPVSRPESVLVEYQDKTGETKRVVAEGLEARVLLHEYDHLQGIVNLSKVNRQIRKSVLSRLKKSGQII